MFLSFIRILLFRVRGFAWSGGGAYTSPSTEKLVEEHRHEQQDPQNEDLPGARHAGEHQAVAQRGDDQDARHGAAYSPSPSNARPAQNDGGNDVELKAEARIARLWRP